MKQKTIWMQLLITGLFISIIMLFLSSCQKSWQVPLRNTEYIYKNNTQHHISITSHNMQRDSVYVILPADSLKLSEDLFIGGSYNNFLISNADSVSVVFDYSRLLFYTPDNTSERNIIKLFNYDYIRVEDEDGYFQYQSFTFEFTEEDYNNAGELPVMQ